MVNSIYFSKEQFESGEMDRFIHQLNELSYGTGDTLMQVLIVPEDCSAYLVQFAQVNWNEVNNCGFRFINEDEFVYKEFKLPDGTYAYFKTEEDYKEFLTSWCQDNPGWVKTSYGTWTNEIENNETK